MFFQQMTCIYSNNMLKFVSNHVKIKQLCHMNVSVGFNVFSTNDLYVVLPVNQAQIVT